MTMQVLDHALDFYELDALLSDEERDVRDRVRSFVDQDVMLILNPKWERA